MVYEKSWIDIANKALLRIGDSQIDTLDGSENTEKFCNQLLPLSINNILGAYDWSCLRERVHLTPLEERPPFGYSFYFQIPENFSKIVSSSTSEYIIEKDKILSNAEYLDIVYIKLPTDATILNPPALLSALVTNLASLLAIPIAGSNSIANNLAQESLMYLNEAKKIDDSNLSPDNDSSFTDDILWINAR